LAGNQDQNLQSEVCHRHRPGDEEDISYLPKVQKIYENTKNIIED